MNGPVNGPVIFIIFGHDMDATWKELGMTRGIDFHDGLGSKLIVDDIYSWAPTWMKFIDYLICQLDVCLSQNLSLSLKKCLFCPERMEFVGHDVCENGNRPAQSKHWTRISETSRSLTRIFHRASSETVSPNSLMSKVLLKALRIVSETLGSRANMATQS